MKAKGQRDTIDMPEVASRLGISLGLAYEMARQGRIPVLRFKRRVVVPVAALDALLGIGSDDERGAETVSGGAE
jgi:excisionase family DNA binding protein